MKLFKFATAVLIVLGSASSSVAHEMRHLGGNQGNGEGKNVFMFHIGFSTEPAFADVMNGISMSLSFHPDAAHDPALTQAVNTADGDVVKIEEAEVMLLNAPSQSAQVIGKNLLPISLDEQGNIRKKWGTDNEYIVYFHPTISGVYGFRLKGIAKHKGYMINFNETFVCGAGSKDIAPTTGLIKTKFNCVEDAVSFPGKASPPPVNRNWGNGGSWYRRFW